jgi:hypothetical protein
MSDLFSGAEVDYGAQERREEYGYVKVINQDGSHRVFTAAKGERPPWIAHDDIELLRWMAERGIPSIAELVTIRDDRPPQRCERCGARGVQVHHTFPKEWWDKKEADRWPMANLCVTCHKVWHWGHDRSAQKITLRILRQKGMHRFADVLERALAEDEPAYEEAVTSIPDSDEATA